MIQIHVKKLLEKAFVFLLILEGNTMYMNLSGLKGWLRWITLIILFLVVIAYLAACRDIPFKFIGGSVALLGFFCVFALIRPYNLDGLFKLCVTVVMMYLMVNMLFEQNAIRDVFFWYKDIIVVLAVVSLLFWLFGSMLGIIPDSGYIKETWTSTGYERRIIGYYYLYFEPQTAEFFEFRGIIRNCGIFAEAPMYSFHLSMAFGIELFLSEKVSKKKLAILILTIITSFSTTGILLVVAELFLKFIGDWKKGGLSWQAIKIAFIPVACVAALAVLAVVWQDKMSTGSGNERMSQFMMGFHAWLSSPWIGYGYGNSSWNAQEGYSNGLFLILNHGGVCFFIPYMLCIIVWVKNALESRRLECICFIVGFVYLLFMTIVQYKWLSLFVLLAYRYPLANRGGHSIEE